MGPTITITDEVGTGGIVTVTPEGVQDVLTNWFAEAYADDPQDRGVRRQGCGMGRSRTTRH